MMVNASACSLLVVKAVRDNQSREVEEYQNVTRFRQKFCSYQIGPVKLHQCGAAPPLHLT
jgi:hypothetical protein